MAIVFWVASVARVVLGLWQGQVFGAEGSLALLCVIGIPCWLVWSHTQDQSHSSEATDSQTALEPENVIRLAERRS